MSLADRSPRYASRLNAFRVGAQAGQGRNAVTTADLIRRAASAGLDAADLNYPDHFEDDSPAELGEVLRAHDMALNGLAMRYYSLPEFKLGAFTHPDRSVRDRGNRSDPPRHRHGCRDGRITDHALAWPGRFRLFLPDGLRPVPGDDTIDAIRRVCDHAPNVEIAIEYKPNEPRAFALMAGSRHHAAGDP